MTLRVHASKLGIVKPSTQIRRNKVSNTDDVLNRELVKGLHNTFADWSLKMSAVDNMCEQVRCDFQPLME